MSDVTLKLMLMDNTCKKLWSPGLWGPKGKDIPVPWKTNTIQQIFLLTHDWSKCIMWLNIPQLKLGDSQEYSPIFHTAHVVKKIWSKYARIFVLGHYLFLEAQGLENCSHLGTDNARRQICEHIFMPNGGYCLFKQ